MQYDKKMNGDLRKKYKDYVQYVLHSDIMDLVENINKNENDFTQIKKLLTDCLNNQFSRLPLQNNTLKQKIFEIFCFAINNAETGLYWYYPQITTFSLDDGKAHTTPSSPTIPKLTPIANIAVNEWINEYGKSKAKNNIKQSPQPATSDDNIRPPQHTQMNTTELLSGNLTDFLEEVRLDIETEKYGYELSDAVFAQTDIFEFLKRTSNNFDLKRVLMVCDDIDEWWCCTDEQPLIIEQIRNVLYRETYLHVINETLSKLKDNHNFKNDYIERLRKNLKWNEDLVFNIISGYDDAFQVFEIPDTPATSGQPADTGAKDSKERELPEVPPEILNYLEEKQMITQNPLQWNKKYASLCAYFVRSYIEKNYKEYDFWAAGERLFHIKNLAQLETSYKRNNSKKPRKHEIIDNIPE